MTTLAITVTCTCFVRFFSETAGNTHLFPLFVLSELIYAGYMSHQYDCTLRHKFLLHIFNTALPPTEL